MAKRPRDRESSEVRVALIDRNVEVEPVYDSLASFIAPLSADEFFRSEYQKRAFVARVHPKHRERRLEDLKAAMDNFNPIEMLRESNSESIHVWMKTRNGELHSIRTDAAQAKTCYDAGHALYFRASELLESTLLPALARDLRFGVAANHRDGQRRAEIETFVAGPGHTTQWHFDFQENFTVQLMGAKKWSFRRSGVEHPHRACATHFNGSEHQRTLHTQFQTVRLNAPNFEGVPPNIEEECESVVLQPGDVLYHPAGIWHKVEAIGDAPSVSINLSFFPATWAEVITESLTHAMLREPSLRQRIQYESVSDAHGQLRSKLEMSREVLASLTPASVLAPAALAQEGHATVVVDDSGDIASSLTTVAAVDAKKLRRNPLAILSLTPDACAFAVPMPDGGESDEASDSSTERTEMVSTVTGYTRFDLTGNFLAEDACIGGIAVSATFFVADPMRQIFEKLALLGPHTVERRSLNVPGALVDALVALGFLCAV